MATVLPSPEQCRNKVLIKGKVHGAEKKKEETNAEDAEEKKAGDLGEDEVSRLASNCANYDITRRSSRPPCSF